MGDESENSRLSRFALSEDDVAYLTEALGRCIAVENKIAEVFYERLFEDFPRARGMFRRDFQSQLQMFQTLLEGAAAELYRPTKLEPLLRRVGARHAEAGLRMGDMEMGRNPFLAAIESAIGGDEIALHREAWNSLYSLLTSILNEGRFHR